MAKTMSLLTTAVVLGVAGCGGSSGTGSSASTPPSTSTSGGAAAPAAASGAGSAVHLAAVPGALAFNTKTLTAKAGEVTLSMANPSSLPHGIGINGNGVDKDGTVVQQGGTSTVTVKLKPGTYTFYCPVPGHKQAGMKGTLTVT